MTHTLYHPYIPPPPAVDHEWVRESVSTRVYRCLVCGSRCREPADVSVTCAELSGQTDSRRRRGGYHVGRMP